ncbi:hypothetical protein D1835_05595 [Enterococcus asini]|nr:hypothetical protein [Enterococcus asini]
MKHKIFFDYKYQNNKKGATKALSHPLFRIIVCLAASAKKSKFYKSLRINFRKFLLILSAVCFC